jgi:excisionase family DNA binding protein
MNYDFLTVDELAALLKVPVSWLYSKTREKSDNPIPFIKIGKYLRFSETSVREWLTKQQKNTTTCE